MSATLTVALSQDRLTLRPGESADLTVTVVNTGTLVSHYETVVRGLEPALFEARPARTELNPGEHATIALRITVPPSGEPHAGRHVLGVAVRDIDNNQHSRCEELALTVPATPGMTVTVSPETTEARSHADYTITLTNNGNIALTAVLSGRAPERGTALTFKPRTLTVAADYTQTAVLEVTALRPWITGSAQTLKIATAAGPLRLQNQAALRQQARIPFAALSALGLFLVSAAITASALLIKANC